MRQKTTGSNTTNQAFIEALFTYPRLTTGQATQC